ncbi:MAG TPA: potassium/proton antiporter [Anaerovoracaceae bacterium]|nr:potassium/proton antiporter [Anaerovoracaceae bacterium]
MSVYMLAISGILLMCLLLNKITSKLGVPTLLAFILLGMLFGTDGLFKISFENYDVAEQVCTIALIFIMFYGGFGTNWETARPIAVKATLLSTLGVAITAGVTGLFCYYALHFEFLESMLIGSVICSTDAASVFAILRSKRMNLKYNTAPMLEVESGSNDPFSYMLTIIVLSLMSGDFSGGTMVYMIFAQIAFGIIFGVFIAAVAAFILKRFTFATDGFDSIFVFTIAIISYAGATLIGGNGYLSAYIAGIILGNQPIKNKRPLVHFFDGITGLVQILIFFLLGLLSTPSQLPGVILPAFAIALFLTFVARPIAVFTILTPFRCSVRQMLVVSWAGLRGAASIVFAIIATVNPAYMNNDVFHIVFFIVLFSILFQGTLLKPISKKLDMYDDTQNVMKTFSDYREDLGVVITEATIEAGNPWIGMPLAEIDMGDDKLVSVIERGHKVVIPNGKTIIQEDDVLIICEI